MEYNRYYTDSRNSTYTMTKVFGWIFYAILITAITAFALPYGLIYFGAEQLFFPILVIGLIGILVLSFAGQIIISRTRSKPLAITIFTLFAVMMGIWIAPLVVAYELSTLAYSLFVTSGIFGIMAIYGAITKRDLSGFGNFLIMLLLGAIFISLINWIIGSSRIDWIVSLVTLGIYVGFIAFDVQRVKRICESGDINTNIALLMALNLYIDFVYIFIRLVAIIGSRRD